MLLIMTEGSEQSQFPETSLERASTDVEQPARTTTIRLYTVDRSLGIIDLWQCESMDVGIG